MLVTYKHNLVKITLRGEGVKEAKRGYRGMTVELKIQSIKQPKIIFLNVLMFVYDTGSMFTQHIMECHAL
jgi:hypothetical protein